MKYAAVDLFSGCGGLSEGLRQAGFEVVLALEKNAGAVETYALNHSKTKVLSEDIRYLSVAAAKKKMKRKSVHLLAGCPPCQGFSAVRRLNKRRSKKDERNSLILDFLRYVRRLKPKTVMMENVPAIRDYYLFKRLTRSLKQLGYEIDVEVVNIAGYGVPQRRRRLVLIGSLLGPIGIASPTGKSKNVRDTISDLKSPRSTKDPLHRVFAVHSKEILQRIKLIPKNGGSFRYLSKKLQLPCHKKAHVGFHDIYGRLSWSNVAPTITGGCLNPSKGRFLHPERNRSITAREAALLQSFPKGYKFSKNLTKTELALQIGNALPPRFSAIQARHILRHLKGS